MGADRKQTVVPHIVARQRSSAGKGAQVRRQPNRWFTPAKQEKFFETLAETSNISLSAEVAGTSVKTVWNWRRKDAEFAQRWRSALEQGYADLEIRLQAQARFGVTSESEIVTTADGRRRRVTRRDSPGDAMRLIAMHRADVMAIRAVQEEGDEPLPPIDHAELAARMRAALDIIDADRSAKAQAIADAMAEDGADAIDGDDSDAD